jgi:hypothetical protein
VLAVGLLQTDPTSPEAMPDTGGDVIELGELAQRIAHLAGCAAVVRRPAEDLPTDTYIPSDPKAFARACRSMGFEPASLDEQIRAVLAVL